MAAPAITPHAYIASNPDLRDPSSSSSPIPSLYSSLSSLRSTNPSAYHANAKWWSTTLHDWAWQGVRSQPSLSSSTSPARLILTVDATLVDAFTLNNDAARPTAIPTAVAAMIKAGELVPLKAFLTAKDAIRKGSRTPVSASSPSSSFIPTPRQVLSFTVARPFWFAMRLAGLSSNDDDDDDGHAGTYDEDEDWPRVTGAWVSLPNLDKATSLVLSQASQQAPTACPLLSMATFRSLVRTALPYLQADADFEVLLKHLSRDKRVAIVEGQVIKLAAEGQGVVQPITDEERSIFAVRETHARLTVQVQDIEKRIEERTKEVKGILKTTTGSSSSTSPRIRHLLSSRRALADLLTRRLASLSQLEGVLLRIEQAHDDVALVAAYEAADEALRGLHKQSGGAQRAEEVMTRLEESVADQRDVEEAMRLGGVGVAGGEGEIDDDELQREMERLELEEREETQEERRRQQVAAASPAAARPEDIAASSKTTATQQQQEVNADQAAASQEDPSAAQSSSQQQQRVPVLNE